MFKDKVRKLRTERNMTQAEFAEVLGVSPNSVYLWERGAVNPQYGTLVLISTKLGVDIKELL